jgi:hypothetical protein
MRFQDARKKYLVFILVGRYNLLSSEALSTSQTNERPAVRRTDLPAIRLVSNTFLFNIMLII